MSLTEEEIKEIINIYKDYYGTDIGIDTSTFDLSVDGNGDIETKGVVVGKKLQSVEELIKQRIILAIMTEGVEINGRIIRLEDLIGLKTKEELQRILINVIVVESLMKLDFIKGITEINIRKINDWFMIEVKVTAELIDEVNINIGISE